MILEKTKKEMLTLWHYKSLIAGLAKREIHSKYRGTILSFAWSILNPLLLLSVYTFVFSFIFQVRWGETDTSRTDFAIILFIGLVIHGLFSDVINRSANLIIDNPNYVKKIIFPLQILPVITLLSALFQLLINTLVIVVAFVILHGEFPVTIYYLPFVLLPLLLLTLGVSWIVTALGTYIRDIGQVIGLATMLLLFLSPIFYPLEALPEGYRSFLYLNPISFVVEQSRNILFWQLAPSWDGLLVYSSISLLILVLGYWCFQKTRKGFADVL